MTRTAAREIAFHISFETGLNPMRAEDLFDCIFDREYYKTLREADEVYAEYPDEVQLAYIRRLTCGVAEHRAELDAYIEKYARGFRIDRISRVAIAVLRTAMYEILYMPEVPDAVAVNEAVELTKKYETPETVKFVNGILGSFMREERPVD